MPWRMIRPRVRRGQLDRTGAADPPFPPELSTKEQELRRLVDAGAASPEGLRALAAKLEEKRSFEDSLWRRDVRPALMQAKKRRFSLVDLRSEPDENRAPLDWRSCCWSLCSGCCSSLSRRTPCGSSSRWSPCSGTRGRRAGRPRVPPSLRRSPPDATD